MGMVRVRVHAPVLGWTPGDVMVVEHDRRLAGLISNGYVELLTPAGDLVWPEVMVIPPEFLKHIKPVGTVVRGQLSVHTVVVPPRSGKGSGAEVWREFLRGQGLEMTDRIGGLDNATKPELVDFWDAHTAAQA